MTQSSEWAGLSSGPESLNEPRRASPVGRVAELARYPVKSMAGERLSDAEFGALGIDGDRRWAVYTGDGGIASGKTTRRFRRIDGMFDLQARLGARVDLSSGADVPTVRFPDGREFRADDPMASAALSTLLEQPLELRPESTVCHHDESRIHVITTAAVRQLEELLGEPVDVARFRANLVLDIDGIGFVEDGWSGGTLTIGDDVQLSLGDGMPRCVMVGLPQPREGLLADARLLKELGRVHEVRFGLKAEVIHGGTVHPGDLVILG